MFVVINGTLETRPLTFVTLFPNPKESLLLAVAAADLLENYPVILSSRPRLVSANKLRVIRIAQIQNSRPHLSSVCYAWLKLGSLSSYHMASACRSAGPLLCVPSIRHPYTNAT